MTPEARAALALLAAFAGWFAALAIMSHIPGMFTRARLELAAAAAVGAVLIYVPDLVALASLPPAVANAICAAVLAGALAFKRAEPPAAKP